MQADVLAADSISRTSADHHISGLWGGRGVDGEPEVRSSTGGGGELGGRNDAGAQQDSLPEAPGTYRNPDTERLQAIGVLALQHQDGRQGVQSVELLDLMVLEGSLPSGSFPKSSVARSPSVRERPRPPAPLDLLSVARRRQHIRSTLGRSRGLRSAHSRARGSAEDPELGRTWHAPD